MRNPHGSFVWYELMTPDAQAASAFYEAVVPGWRFGEASPDHNGYREISIEGGGHAGGVLPLTDEMKAQGARPGWLGYIGVDDVDSSVSSIRAAGGKVLMEAFDIPEVGRIALLADPQGVPFYVMRGAIDAPSDAFSTDSEGHVSWNELNTSDPVAARAFYGERFGWGSDEFMPMGELGEYRFLTHGGQTIGAICGVMPGRSGGWRYYIRVPSIGAAKAAIEENGGTVAHGPHEVPGGDWILIGFDPQGAEFALVGKR